jgi:hypothetical protein
VTPSDEEIRALAQEILAGEPYARWREGPSAAARALAELGRSVADAAQALWARLPAAWTEYLAGIWERLRAGVQRGVEQGADEPWVRVALAIALGAVVALLVAQIALALRSMRSLPGPGRRRPGGARVEEDLDNLAARLAAEGRHVEAAHCVQLSALALLLDRGWIELGPFEPNRTLRRRLAGSPLPGELAREFVRLLDRLEETWFRDRRAGGELYDAWRRLRDRLGALPEAA